MKSRSKGILVFLYLPFLGLAGLYSILRLIFTLTVVFTISIGNEWHNNMLLWVNDAVKKLKE